MDILGSEPNLRLSAFICGSILAADTRRLAPMGVLGSELNLRLSAFNGGCI
jgi:hypothetical protein